MKTAITSFGIAILTVISYITMYYIALFLNREYILVKHTLEILVGLSILISTGIKK